MTKHDNVSQGKIMKATEFVKKFGLEKSKEAIDKVAWCETAYCLMLGHGCFKSNSDCCVDIKDLKRLVESHELLKIIDLESPLIDELVNELIETGRPRLVELGKRIKQAIADVEACHEVN
ncbi:hypothetical protein ACLIL3_002760 [Acinetobacter radioresistens]|uniref:hypothetical protein n=1 Tax=Acinetobacter radioresistens TaxID=40216 RepID=UPI003984DC60